ncbi:MAG: ABC transporter permease [Spirillospora sp.]
MRLRSRRRRGKGGAPEFSALRPRDLAAEALVWITRRRARSLLTALGTLLGVGAFVATIGITTTVSAQVSEKFDALRATEVTAQVGGDGTVPDDYRSRLLRVNGVVEAGRFWRVNQGAGVPVHTTPAPAPVAAGAGEGAGAGGAAGAQEQDAAEPLPVIAADPAVFAAARVHLAAGRTFDTGHDRRGDAVVVLGSSAARGLGVDAADLARRPAVFLGGRAYTVIGIVDAAQRFGELTASLIVPGSGMRHLTAAERTANVLIVTRLGAAQVVGAQVPLALRPDDPGAVTVTVPPDPRTLRQGVERDLSMLFLLLAGVSLVIGTVGIANTTLVSVMERVGEIGLRRALGAQRRHIAAQFLTESAALGSLGGILGASLAVICVVAISVSRGWTPVMQPALVLAAPLIGTVTGLVAGAYPAWKAAGVTPVTALNR